MSKKIAIYPGSFDPITNGHYDIIIKSLKFIDHLVIAIAEDNNKNSVFTIDERVSMIKQEILHIKKEDKKIEVKSFSGLLTKFAENHNVQLIIRGLRAVSDFEYEFQMSCMNSKLSPDIETIFLSASEKTHFISSKLIKEISKLEGDVSEFVSDNVKRKLKQKFNITNI